MRRAGDLMRYYLLYCHPLDTNELCHICQLFFENTVQVLNERDQCNQLRAIFLSPPWYQFDGHTCRAELFQNALSIS